jgi:hypothetical protein
MQIRHLSNADGDFGRRRLSDALRKGVDGIAPSDCGARGTFGINEDVADLKQCIPATERRTASVGFAAGRRFRNRPQYLAPPSVAYTVDLHATSFIRLWLSPGRRFLIDLAIFGGLLSARFASSAEIA